MALRNTQHHPGSCCRAAKGPTSRPPSLPPRETAVGAPDGTTGGTPKQKGLWDCEQWEPLRKHQLLSVAPAARCSARQSGSDTAELSPAPLRRVWRTKVTTTGRAKLQQAARADTPKKTKERARRTSSGLGARGAPGRRKTGDGSLERGDDGNARAGRAPAESGLPGGSHRAASAL